MVKELREEFPSLIDRAYNEFRKSRHVEDIMSREVCMIEPGDSMLEAAKLMGEKHIGSLIVKLKGKPEAIVTERDLLSKVISEGRTPKSVKVREVMSLPLITISPTMSIKEAAQTMIAKKGRLAVFKGSKLVGIITASDLISSLPEVPETELTVDDMMTKPVVTLDSTTTVEAVAKRMGKDRIGSIIITSNGKPVGIFTERDLLTTFLAKEKSLNRKVGEVASSPLITVSTQTHIHAAAFTMASKHVRRLPVVRGSGIIGIITARDLVEAYAK